MTYRRRHARPGDVADLLALWQVAAENAARPDDDAMLHRLLNRDPEALLLATDDDRVVASLVAGRDGWRAHLYRLAVHPDHRRHGLARVLVAAAEKRFAGLGAIRVDAMVLDGNDDGAALWASLGYEPQPQWRRWIRFLDAD